LRIEGGLKRSELEESVLEWMRDRLPPPNPNIMCKEAGVFDLFFSAFRSP
jgi:hypothetical protein